MKLFVSNKIEILADQLARVLEEPLSSPFVSETVVVQSKGMERWLCMQLAAYHGICANMSFPFPNAAVQDLFTRVVPHVPEESIFDVEGLTWSIMEKLPAHVREKGFESVAQYIKGDTSGIKLYQLSRELAGMFDQYIIFRDKAVLDWQEHRFFFPEKDRRLEYWQSVLWRGLAAGHEHEHRASLKKAFMKALGPDPAKVLPERINIFGLSYLPRFHLEVFHAVSAYIPVNLFFMNPCCQYWGDIRSGSEMTRILMKSRDTDEETLHLEEGNSLLASFGDLGRELFDMLQDFDMEETDGFEEIAPTSMLACVQSDILNLQNPAPENKRVVALSDTSLQIHSCHNPMREVEVLHDNLLAAFDENPGLRPEDIVVMAPDIETYAPFIQAVFDIDRRDAKYIPFSISDRTVRTQSDMADTFAAILDLAEARFEASKVLSLLECGSLRRKFGITEDNLELIGRWVQDTRIAWGRDAGEKHELGLPGYAENTWRFGLDRLLLGYAMPPGHERDFAGILPYSDMEGDDAVVLGNFVSFVSSLFDRADSLKKNRDLDDWSQELTGLLAEFFLVEEAQESDYRRVYDVVSSLAAIRKRTGFTGMISLEVIRAYIGQNLEVRAEGVGFLSSGITFCAMLPMRSIPFEMVCLLGMNHDSYPRQTRTKGFDLMARNPRRGDRNRRADDLYLFLEAMLSARKILYMSYEGQSAEDNTEIPPSVLISSLLDYINRAFVMDDGSPVADRVLVRHALQAFNPRYFTAGSGLFSYSRDNAGAARCLLEKDRRDRVFWAGSLDEPGDEWKMMDVGSLCDFYTNPARFLLRNRLGIVIPQGSLSVNDREPFDLDALEQYTLRQEYIHNTLKGMDSSRCLQLFRMSGQLPHGAPGDVVFTRIQNQTGPFIKTVQEICGEREQKNIQVDLNMGGFVITGVIPVYGSGLMVRFRHADLKGRDLIRTWLLHLVLCATLPGSDMQSMCIARDRLARFSRVDDCREILCSLLERYWHGLMAPLHFFPDASWRYAVPGWNKDKSPKDPMAEARKIWNGGYNPGENQDIYYQTCFRGIDPLDEEFAAVSKEIYGPLLDHADMGKGAGR